MNIILFLLLFPFFASLLLLFNRKSQALRAQITYGASGLIIAGCLWLTIRFFGATFTPFNIESHWINQAMLLAEIFFAGLIITLSLKHKRMGVAAIAILQIGMTIWFEFTYGESLRCASNLFVDNLSLIMALIIGIIGSLICIYSVGYMKDFQHHHHELPDRRNFFFFILFAFLSAMFGVVFSNNLMWLYFFWEVTTICSFLLIGFKGDEISINNAFKALLINLGGGVFFLGGVIGVFMTAHTIELQSLLQLSPSLALIPLIGLGVAGLTKSAQMPFSGWLLGAMVAPTPVSALLHSSTMVKAGVYLLIKLAPLYQNSLAGVWLSLIGGFTFLITSILAISQSDAKRVLAYSTIANLGLIVLCAGIGTNEAVWAGILLIIFHAVAKGLLFLCVGVVEHKMGDRNIETMEGMAAAMPNMTWLMLIGMSGMFLAPFGMLISKWAVLKAIVDSNPILSILLVYGSAATLFFWVKWMGKLVGISQRQPNKETLVNKSEWTALYALGAGTVLMCLLFPLASHTMIEPYILNIYGGVATLDESNILIMLLMMGLIVLFPIGVARSRFSKHQRLTEPYLAGINVRGMNAFNDSLGGTKPISFSNYYMTDYFGEAKMMGFGLGMAWLLLLIFIATYPLSQILG